ncbi:ethylene-responsive transcription factor CRF6 [Lactuca sativa]|uniref:AP2/ERF domain-containing protein n=1 Tax=Lactuca sativa TaxID=4236 RepID=A0A9R1UL18_LACSA|nr:ethylene-responsive transcription factor CRF6 [Lactuca sativa]KAJ0189547.1 hypothetical protein LSAT_V11C800404900 [Lactuca sativa]
MADQPGVTKMENSAEDDNKQQMEATVTYPRKVRVIVSDPHATDSSSDEGGNGERPSRRRIVHEIVLGLRAGENKDDGEASKRRGSMDEKENERIRGKLCSEIRDPFNKKRVWFGTFDTAEKSLKPYKIKKEKFRAGQAAENQQVTPVSKGVPEGKKVAKLDDDPTRKQCKGVRKTESGRWSAKIRDPVKKSQVWLGTFDTKEEASEAIESKKVEFGSKRTLSNAESGSSLKTPKTET